MTTFLSCRQQRIAIACRRGKFCPPVCVRWSYKLFPSQDLIFFLPQTEPRLSPSVAVGQAGVFFSVSATRAYSRHSPAVLRDPGSDRQETPEALPGLGGCLQGPASLFRDRTLMDHFSCSGSLQELTHTACREAWCLSVYFPVLKTQK